MSNKAQKNKVQGRGLPLKSEPVIRGRLLQLGILLAAVVIIFIVVKVTDSSRNAVTITRRTDPKGVAQVWVPAGCFLMGTDPKTDLTDETIPQHTEEFPQHKVCITKGYWLDEYEVTETSYDQFISTGGYTNKDYWSDAGWQWKNANNPSPSLNGDTASTLPHGGMSYYEAEAYAHWRGGRLPTEAEWEYAARGPNSLIFPWGNEYGFKPEIDPPAKDPGNFRGKGKKKAQSAVAVGSYPVGRSWIGAADMSGNLFEWVADVYDATYYAHSPTNDPTGSTPVENSEYVIRGGSWAANLFWARGAARDTQAPGSNLPFFGTRVVLTQ
ncbi:MAG: SUMF1/EgtB/PvdO family nonheme iron enzyme [Chloroflexota bacterium]